MIPRYARQEMVAIWAPENKFNIWLNIECAAAKSMARHGIIPQTAADNILGQQHTITLDVERIDAIEAEVKHDVIAFLTHVAEQMGEDARFLHQGMTSSDVLDTCLNIQLKQSGELLLIGLERLLNALKTRAMEHKHTPMVGRSHGIHAEPITFGLKLASHFTEFERNKQRLITAIDEISTCAISGAVGTFAHIPPVIEEEVAAELGLKPEPISTQVIPRDRHAAYFAALGLIASSVERLATDIRHMQRTEVREVEEFFSKGQKGSSAMPHKRNPVLTENLTGLARMVRSAVIPAMENVALWHERDISHSSVERYIGPDANITLDFALHRLAGVIEGLVIYPDNMMKNLTQLKGLIHSQQVLLALTQNGMSREQAYRVVQRNAMDVWNGKGDLKSNLQQDEDVKSTLPQSELNRIFDLNTHFVNVNAIFERVF